MKFYYLSLLFIITISLFSKASTAQQICRESAFEDFNNGIIDDAGALNPGSTNKKDEQPNIILPFGKSGSRQSGNQSNRKRNNLIQMKFERPM